MVLHAVVRAAIQVAGDLRPLVAVCDVSLHGGGGDASGDARGDDRDDDSDDDRDDDGDDDREG